MTPPIQQTQSNKPLAILDTNIFGYLLDQTKLDQILTIISELSNDYELALSTYIYYELVSKGTKDVQQLTSSLRLFKMFSIDNYVLIFAGLMTCLHVEKGGDSIMASTGFLNTAVILTANQTHYPEPYFHEIRYWHVNSKTSKNRTVTLNIHLLQPDTLKIANDINNIELIQEVNRQSLLTQQPQPTVTQPILPTTQPPQV